MNKDKVAFLHYSAPPVIGGVEAVMSAHARLFLAAGYPVTFISGEGSAEALPQGAQLVLIPEMSSQHPQVLAVQKELDQGRIPAAFEPLRERLLHALQPVLENVDTLIVHNVFTKHFNLALTAALMELVDRGAVKRCIHWGHDFTWTSPNSRDKVFPGYPWDLLRQPHARIRQVTISEQRREELAEMMHVTADSIAVVYNGVDLETLLGISAEGCDLIHRMDLLAGDLNIILPVRVTTAKNIELAERVVAVLKNSGRRAHLVITGPPDPHSADSMAYYQSLLDLRARLGVREEVHFAYDCGADPREPYYLTETVVSDLMRISDVLLFPSHREGFGMPVLEAGLTRLPVIASDRVPAAREIGGDDVRLFSPDDSPESVARLIMEAVDSNPVTRFGVRTRQKYRWESIFSEQIEPLLQG